MLLIWMSFVLFSIIKGAVAISNVQLIIPPLVRAGGMATMLCLFDLEEAPLYTVKWYRGQHEFYRYMPQENPPTKVFQIPGINVDVVSSNQHQVTLTNLPTFLSGEISCEITTDAPTFSTVCVSDMLNVQRLNIDLTTPKTQYLPGELLQAECVATTTAKMAFYINSLRVPGIYVTQESSHKAVLNIILTEKEHFQFRDSFRLQCSGGISDQYYISTKNVIISKKVYINSLAPKRASIIFVIYILVSIVIIFL